jgi:hypothetical protein
MIREFVRFIFNSTFFNSWAEIIFKLSDVPKPTEQKPSDDFFDVTKDDLLYLINDLHRQ